MISEVSRSDEHEKLENIIDMTQMTAWLVVLLCRGMRHEVDGEMSVHTQFMR